MYCTISENASTPHMATLMQAFDYYEKIGSANFATNNLTNPTLHSHLSNTLRRNHIDHLIFVDIIFIVRTRSVDIAIIAQPIPLQTLKPTAGIGRRRDHIDGHAAVLVLKLLQLSLPRLVPIDVLTAVVDLPAADHVVLLVAGRFQMFVQVGLQRERLVAPLALEVLVRRVGLHVGPQVGPIGEGFAAVTAAVRFFAGVGPEVTLQKPRTGEELAADAAAMGELVRE